MYQYSNKQMYQIGQVYRILSDIIRPNSGDLNADIFPMRHLILILPRVPKNKIPKRVDSILMKIMEDIEPDDMEELIVSGQATPIEIRGAWQQGYSEGYKLLEPSPIERKRKQLGITQQGLANKVGVNQKDISLWENGYRNPNVENIKKLSIVLNCTIDELLN